MSCNCNKAIPNSACLDNFIIGSVDFESDYRVMFKTPTGRVDIYPAVFTGYSDLFYVALPKVRIGEIYEIWISREGDAIEKKVPFTVGAGDDAMEVNCINVEFEQCFSNGVSELVDETAELQ